MDSYTKTILLRLLFWGMWGSIAIWIGIVVSYFLTCRDMEQLQQQKKDTSISSAVANQNQYQLQLSENQKQTLKKSSFIFGMIALLMTILFLTAQFS